MLVVSHRQRVFLATLRHRYRCYFFTEEAPLTGVLVTLLGSGGKGVRGFTADAQILSHILCRLRHGIATKLLEDCRVGETGTNGAVENRHIPAERFFRLRHDKRRPAHGFRTTGNDQLPLPHSDHTGGIQSRGQATATETVHGNSRHRFRQAGKQTRMASHVTGILTGLIGVADDHVFKARRLETIALYQLADHPGQQVIRPHRRQRAAVAAKGSAQTIVNIGIKHYILRMRSMLHATRSNA